MELNWETENWETENWETERGIMCLICVLRVVVCYFIICLHKISILNNFRFVYPLTSIVGASFHVRGFDFQGSNRLSGYHSEVGTSSRRMESESSKTRITSPVDEYRRGRKDL